MSRLDRPRKTPPAVAEWLVVFNAESIVSYARARAELIATWPTYVLRDLCWVAHDDAWSAVCDELTRRGDEPEAAA